MVSGVWEPNYFNHTPRAVRLVAGGWSLSAINSMRSGLPLTITSGTDFNLDGTNNDRANLVGDPVFDPHRPRNQVVAEWFNTKAFAQPKNGTDGNAGRNIIDGPGYRDVDMSIMRSFHIREGMRLMFRGDATNAFNVVSLSNPGTRVGTSSTFGKVTTANPMRQLQLGMRLTF